MVSEDKMIKKIDSVQVFGMKIAGLIPTKRFILFWNWYLFRVKQRNRRIERPARTNFQKVLSRLA